MNVNFVATSHVIDIEIVTINQLMSSPRPLHQKKLQGIKIQVAFFDVFIYVKIALQYTHTEVSVVAYQYF